MKASSGDEEPPVVLVATAADFMVGPGVSVATRTLTAAGFTVTNCIRQRRHAGLECERTDLMGCAVRYLIVLCEGQTPPEDDLSNIQRDAERTGRLLVLVAQEAGENVLAWSDFLLVMGGAVPVWRALGPEYDTALLTLSQNQLPDGVVGEAWRLFEEAVGDGLEFLFGRRVRRLGGAARASRVADLLAQTPDTRLLVVDSKASGDLFDASWPNLRPLVEYVKRQQTRQRGEIDVSAALIVGPSFKQDATALASVAGQFLAETRVPAAFLTARTLLGMVQELRDRPRLRTAVSWANVFCQPRLITADAFDAEITAVERERFHSDGAPGLAPSDRIPRVNGS